MTRHERRHLLKIVMSVPVSLMFAPLCLGIMVYDRWASTRGLPNFGTFAPAPKKPRRR